ncbi:hypothetical protein ICW40_17030 [Actinotalea ferrariae]|uniref:hypothetical protein n=1 Tax=Actinotalea ferrariae TaxID=1386098 RepID=UPI001C8BDA51|nr:hypothetical protein [Actinotalea ferrariae]MBX9246498.1 hypothetical protein [Actinotalea ferrariae]
MHPDAYLVIYRHRIDHLEHRLEQERSMRSRLDVAPLRGGGRKVAVMRALHGRYRRVTSRD